MSLKELFNVPVVDLSKNPKGQLTYKRTHPIKEGKIPVGFTYHPIIENRGAKTEIKNLEFYYVYKDEKILVWNEDIYKSTEKSSISCNIIGDFYLPEHIVKNLNQINLEMKVHYIDGTKSFDICLKNRAKSQIDQ